MKNKGFTLKVSDILLQSGYRDTITFVNLFSTKLPGLLKKGIDITLCLQSLNKKEMLITIEHGEAYCESSCDRCGKEFNQTKYIEDIHLQAKVSDHEILDEDLLQINAKDFTVDIEDVVVDCFHLYQPIKNLCDECLQKQTDDLDDEEVLSVGIDGPTKKPEWKVINK